MGTEKPGGISRGEYEKLEKSIVEPSDDLALEKEDSQTPFEEFVDDRFEEGGVYKDLVDLKKKNPKAEFELSSIFMRDLPRLINEIKAQAPEIVAKGMKLEDLKKLEDMDYINIEQGKAEDPVSYWIGEKFNDSGIMGKLVKVKNEFPETEFEVDSIMRKIAKVRSSLEKNAREFIEHSQGKSKEEGDKE